MKKIQRVLRDIQNLQDFYKRTKPLRTRVKSKDTSRSRVEEDVRSWAGPHGPVRRNDRA